MADYTYLPACTTEDSTNCYWDAAQHGNGAGTSFIDIDGTLHTVTVPADSYILSAVAFTDGTPGVAYQENPLTPAYDLTLPIVIVAAAVVASVATLVVGFIRRSHS